MNLLARENEGKVHDKAHPRKNNFLFQKEEKLKIDDDFHAQNVIRTECLAKTWKAFVTKHLVVVPVSLHVT